MMELKKKMSLKSIVVLVLLIGVVNRGQALELPALNNDLGDDDALERNIGALIAQEQLTTTQKKRCSCPVCHEAFANKRILTVHMRTHSNEGPFQCEICDVSLADTHTLLKHQKTLEHRRNQRFPCFFPGCGESFSSITNLKRHTCAKHGGDKTHKCPHCLKVFSRTDSLEYHIRVHTKEMAYKCYHPGCGKAFRYLKGLKAHQQRMHNKT